MSGNSPPLWANAMQERILGAMAAVRADVAALRTEMANLRIEMATRANIADIMARIDRLQEDLTR
jgi:hypothetical protein